VESVISNAKYVLGTLKRNDFVKFQTIGGGAI
jgi:hypothetical protein